jgi:hypothetical protein
MDLPFDDHLTIRDGDHGVFDDIEEFLTGSRPEPEFDRVLKTALFTDIVGSTERAITMGDQRWLALLDRHDAAVFAATTWPASPFTSRRGSLRSPRQARFCARGPSPIWSPGPASRSSTGASTP